MSGLIILLVGFLRYAKVPRTNTFTDNECILSVVVQVISSLRWLGNLVFTCLFVPARPVSVI